jgi:cytochrome c oxidase subunit 2
MSSSRKVLFIGLAALFAALAPGCSFFSRGKKAAAEEVTVPADAPVRIVDVIARKYTFDPSTIRVREGELVVLQLTSRDVVHGIGIPSAKIKADITPGQITEVHFYARKKGIVGFQCSNYCGIGHFNMRGKIIVE